jgi:16S rRNA C967 or C1407 C5-methylase (RsmB/RsmF family)/NOL1/NOP2/fmu family ribosome biogenesis protein
MRLPESLLSRMSSQLGNHIDAFLQSIEEPSVTSIRLNPKKVIDHERQTKVPWAQDGYYLSERPVFTLDPLLHAGAYYVQEASSMLIEQALLQNNLHNSPILALDLCAAPGGKSTHLISLLHEESILVSNEIIKSRANILTENMTKWGYPNVVVTQNDPFHFQKLEGLFDLIVVDAPCSGEGLIRKDPEALNEWSENNLKLCSSRQQRIIADVWPALKENGILIYSTCTYNPDENMRNLEWMKTNFEFNSLPLVLKNDLGVEYMNKNNIHAYQCWPHKVKGEGFFISVLQKIEKTNTVNLKSNKQKLNLASKSVSQEVATWIKSAETFNFYQDVEYIFAFPSQHDAILRLLFQQLNIVHVGLPLGEIKKNKIIPNHALALSTVYNDSFPSIELDKEKSLAYLHRDSIDLSDAPKGFVLMTHQGLGLGWANNLGNRSNNMYPVNWRIRMDLH